MTTGSVIQGSAVSKLIVCRPAPGMLKLIVSVPGVLLADVMASRSEPGPESFVLVTTNGDGGGPVVAPPNSDVLPLLSVAVATSLSPAANGTANVSVIVFVVPASAAR